MFLMPKAKLSKLAPNASTSISSSNAFPNNLKPKVTLPVENARPEPATTANLYSALAAFADVTAICLNASTMPGPNEPISNRACCIPFTKPFSPITSATRSNAGVT